MNTRDLFGKHTSVGRKYYMALVVLLCILLIQIYHFTDFKTVIVIFALLISIVTFIHTSQKSWGEYIINMQLDIDKMLVDSPELWAIFDSHKNIEDASPHGQAKREAFIYLHLDMFELVYDYYKNFRLCSRWKNHWVTWERYIEEFLRSSSQARGIFANERIDRLYMPDFVCYIKGLSVNNSRFSERDYGGGEVQ